MGHERLFVNFCLDCAKIVVKAMKVRVHIREQLKTSKYACRKMHLLTFQCNFIINRFISFFRELTYSNRSSDTIFEITDQKQEFPQNSCHLYNYWFSIRKRIIFSQELLTQLYQLEVFSKERSSR